jgi:hypothetical protein
MSDIPEIQEVTLLSLIIGVKCPSCGLQMLRGASSLGKDCNCLSCGQPYRLPTGLVLYAPGQVPLADTAAAKQLLADTRHVHPDHDPDCPDCHGTGARDSGGTHPWGEPAMVTCGCSSPTAPLTEGGIGQRYIDKCKAATMGAKPVDYRLCDGDIDD